MTDVKNLPKIELHLHLDCSLSFDVVQKLDPEISEQEYTNQFKAPAKCRDLADYIWRSQQSISLMQSARALELVTQDLFNQLKADNVIYAEIRFAPLEHTRESLSATEVVEAVNDAVSTQIAETGIQAGVILCTLRHYSKNQSMKTAKLVNQHRNSHVAGFDIAGDEAGYPIGNHISAFEFANSKGLNCTAHAGEARGADSVWETLEYFNPSRLGHGVRSIEDKKLMAHLVESNIHLEVCPTSNVQTDVYESIEDHKINQLLEAGLSLGVNTDTRTISDVTLADEYQTMEKVFDWKQSTLFNANMEAANHAFTDDKTKSWLRAKLKQAYNG